MKLLGKDLYELDSAYKKLDLKWLQNYFSIHNLRVMRHRVDNTNIEDAIRSIVYDGNEIRTTSQILKATRYIYEAGVLTEEEWDKASPYIEEGLLFNKDYCDVIDKMKEILVPFFDKYIGAKETMEKRLPLEFWQGRLSCGHWANPNEEYEYK